MFSSPEELMGIFGPIVETFCSFLPVPVPDVVHGSTIGGQAVHHDGVRLAIAFHRLLLKAASSLFVSGLGGKGFYHLAFMIDGAPEVLKLVLDPHEELINVPSP